MSKQFYLKEFSLAYKNRSISNILFSLGTLLGSVWPIDRTLSGGTTPGQSGSEFLAIKV